ncbi:tryptophan 2,3-dioxygenase family protein [Embleya sp. NPDC005575]|uniref:tryptophan 2,3-dioxygenase family protein n=1 Tax=Embleya sp. NPDC005575 TaxID=3156892 RepID=UPI0033B19DB9
MNGSAAPTSAPHESTADGAAEPTYDGYLRLPTILTAQAPTTAESDRYTHAAEHFFIVAHQSCELWLKQALLDLNLAADAVRSRPRDLGLCLEQVRRVTHVLTMIAEHFTVLERLTVASFARFRGALGRASGAQSGQFRALYRALGLYGADSELFRGFLSALAERDLTVAEVYRRAPHSGLSYLLAEGLVDLSQAVRRCQLAHVEVVVRQIGARPGTGRTTGADFLARRLAVPFPELWEARTALHTPGGVDSVGVGVQYDR